MKKRLKLTALVLSAILAADALTDQAYIIRAAGAAEEGDNTEIIYDTEEADIITSDEASSYQISDGFSSDEMTPVTPSDEQMPDCYSDEPALYISAEQDSEDSVEPDFASTVQTASDVTEEMCRADCWYDKSVSSGIDIDSVLLDTKVISEFNKMLTNDPETHRYDLENFAVLYNASELRDSLVSGTTTAKKELYAGHEVVDPQEYYKSIADQISETAYSDKIKDVQYALAVRRTTVNSIPVSVYIGNSEYDTDDEKVNSALNVNEPFIIEQKATVFGEDFYWGYTLNCTGWVAAADLAVCDNKDQWLTAWKTEPGEDDFIVVTQNKIVLEPSEYSPELSEVMLTFGTILKTVPDDKIPALIDARGPWNNYVVYLPLRDDNGKYVQGIALISQHYEVSTGFLKMTQKEILRVAFNNLGDRYGWGGMQGSMDCSLFTRNIYRCFGLELPRNTTWQKSIPGRGISFEGMSDEDKLNAMKLMPAGTLFFFQGHIMMYTGMDTVEGQEMAYVISDTGGLSDSEGELNVRNMYSIILNPLSVRRRNGSTWLTEISCAILPVSEPCFEYISENVRNNTTFEPDPGKKVPVAEGQTYASSGDTMPLETFLNNTGNIYISFYNVDDAEVDVLTATVIKGSKITTKAPVKALRCTNSAAKYSISKTNGLATLTLNRSGIVSFEMQDGKTYDVDFKVETPKAQSAAVKEKIKKLKESGEQTASFDVQTLFGTTVSDGKLEVTSGKNANNAVVGNNILMLDLATKDTVKIRYTYLNKKYSMTISVK